ncbi:MAG: maleylpyruvate isomerase family mycothiol-dependent enzyme [Chloroflexi bacterium]|nr:maleylpyruvate isomerase family mycothiol-dependent enzyme [Chloroflexota bacterium]
MPTTNAYLDHLEREVAAFSQAAHGDLETPVPSCPGWTVATLVAHLSGLYGAWTKVVDERAQEPGEGFFATLDLPPQVKEWFAARGQSTLEVPPGIVDLYERTAGRLVAALRSARSDEPVYSWFPSNQTVGFYHRRAPLETAIHRWDLQGARGRAEPIDGELACDGIDELLDVMVPGSKVFGVQPRLGSGETYHFHRTDGPGEWLVRFEPDGLVVTREHAKGDVAVRGTASDLFLFLWGRIPADRFEVFGDRVLLDRYFELAPPM